MLFTMGGSVIFRDFKIPGLFLKIPGISRIFSGASPKHPDFFEKYPEKSGNIPEKNNTACVQCLFWLFSQGETKI